MFGDNQAGQIQDTGAVAPMDPAVMSDPASQQAPAPTYQDNSQIPASNPVLQMHHDAVAASQVAPADQTLADTPSVAHDDELLTIKQDALTALTPLVGNLDQSAEEKFRTTMMLIQASDDRSLVRQAYESAQAIEDPKMKAQALLDVVNEINYFTSHTS